MSTKKFSSYIHLLHFQVKIYYRCQNNMHRIFLRYKEENLGVINSFLLSESLSNKSCLISFNAPQWVYLYLIDPFTPNDFCIIRQLNKILDSVTFHKIHLFLHGIVLEFCFLAAYGLWKWFRIIFYSNVIVRFL
jgi:hypothetical protein